MRTCVTWLWMLMAGAFLSGCANLGQMQSALNDIDGFWGQSKRNILAEKGSKVLPVSISHAKRSVSEAARSMGFVLVRDSDSSLNFRARSPLPFTEDEYTKIRTVEEPIMQAMAANHVGGFTSSFFVLSSGDTDVLVDVRLEPKSQDATLVKLDFTLQWVKGRQQSGLLLGEHPPPEALRRGLDKFWDAVQRSL